MFISKEILFGGRCHSLFQIGMDNCGQAIPITMEMICFCCARNKYLTVYSLVIQASWRGFEDCLRPIQVNLSQILATISKPNGAATAQTGILQLLCSRSVSILSFQNLCHIVHMWKV